MEINNLNNLEKLVNAELSSKIQNSEIKYDELLLKISVNEIVAVITFLKSNNRLKFKCKK